MEDKKEKIRCANCGSTMIYVRIKDNTMVCRTCGHVTELEEDKKDG